MREYADRDAILALTEVERAIDAGRKYADFLGERLQRIELRPSEAGSGRFERAVIVADTGRTVAVVASPEDGGYPEFAAAWDVLYPHDWGRVPVGELVVGIDGRVRFR